MKTFNKCISLEDLETLSDLNKLMIQAFLSEYTAAHQYLMAGHEARGNGYPDVLPEYEEHCEEERKHADEWLLRLEEIGIVLRVDLSQIQTEAPAWTPITTSASAGFSWARILPAFLRARWMLTPSITESGREK